MSDLIAAVQKLAPELELYGPYAFFVLLGGGFLILLRLYLRQDAGGRKTLRPFLWANCLAALGVLVVALAYFVMQHWGEIRNQETWAGEIPWNDDSAQLLSGDENLFLNTKTINDVSKSYCFLLVVKNTSKEGTTVPLQIRRPRPLRPVVTGVSGGGGMEDSPDHDIERVDLVVTRNCGRYRYKPKSGAERSTIECDSPTPPSTRVSGLGFLTPEALALDMEPRKGEAPPRPATPPRLSLPDLENLLSETSGAGTKIEVLDRMLAMGGDLEKLLVEGVANDLPVPLALQDLRRHPDPAIQNFSTRLLSGLNLEAILVQGLVQAKSFPKNTAFLLRTVDPEARERILNEAARRLKELRRETQAADCARTRRELAGVPRRDLIPTPTVQGDRYYVRATWDSSGPKAKACLTGLFNRSLTSDRSLAQEAELMTRGYRLVYWYSRQWALWMASEIEKCGGKAEFVSGRGTR